MERPRAQNYQLARQAETKEQKIMAISLLADVSLAKDVIELSAVGAKSLGEKAASVPYIGERINKSLQAYAGLVEEFEKWLRGGFEAAFQGDIKQFGKVANKCRYEMTKKLAELPFAGTIAGASLGLEHALKARDKKAIAKHGGILALELLMIALPVKPRAEGIWEIGEGAAEVAAEAAKNFAADFEARGGIDQLRSGGLKASDVAALFVPALPGASAKVVRHGVAGGIKLALRALVLPDAFKDAVLDGPFTEEEIAQEFIAAASPGEEPTGLELGPEPDLELDLGEDYQFDRGGEGCCERGRREGGFFAFLFCCASSPKPPAGRPPEPPRGIYHSIDVFSRIGSN
eukprot:tig00021365_g20820.t1